MLIVIHHYKRLWQSLFPKELIHDNNTIVQAQGAKEKLYSLRVKVANVPRGSIPLYF